MKRLGAFVSITILVIGILGVFGVPDVKAQTTNAPQQALTLSQYQERGGTIFANELAMLQTKKQDPSATGTVPVSPQVVDALIAAVNGASNIFSSTFSNSSTDTATSTYKRALLASVDYISTQQRQNGQVLRQPYANNVIGTFTRQLSDEAIAAEKAVALQQGGYTPEETQTLAEDLSNARANAAGNAAAANKEPTGKCSLVAPSNISACIDEGFAWVIKNTLLQLAGFLVWLTANMLNFAIQISILNFSSWAPSALYPIWMVVRQMVSLFVVFAGLYLGFMYIIGKTEAFGKYVGWLVIFALFVNFSYPVSRVLVDISNIISLNVYSAAIGPEALTGTASNTAGSLIMNKLGLLDLVASATSVDGQQSSFIKNINSTPGALIAVVFVLYAAYIFFMATAIIATRTAVLVFLTVASPLLLVDSVVPKLGDAAVKMRKMFFEQLAVAPVFMIMLALTLKFMDVFHDTKALSSANQSLEALQRSGENGGVQTFFGILMMLIMLHIMLKVTKSLSGEAGQYATNFMGKVGGFGLAAATGGAGLLARGTIGAGASRLRDSAWMDKLQGSRVGRGMYGLTNSLAQSTYDARNIGAVSSTMSKAGLTGGFGMSMQKATIKNIDDARAARTAEIEKKGSIIKDDNARAAYFSSANSGRLVRVQNEKLTEVAKSIDDKRQAQLEQMMTTTDLRKRESLINQAIIAKDYAMADKLRAGDEYHKVDNNNPQAAQQKADLFKKMGIDNAAIAKEFLKKDPFKDLANAHEELVKQLQEDAAKINRKTPEGEAAYRDIQAKLGEENASFRQKTEKLRKNTLAAFAGVSTGTPPATPVDFNMETGEIRDFAAYAAARRKEKQAAAMRGETYARRSNGDEGEAVDKAPNTPTPNKPTADDEDVPLPELVAA